MCVVSVDICVIVYVWRSLQSSGELVLAFHFVLFVFTVLCTPGLADLGVSEWCSCLCLPPHLRNASIIKEPDHIWLLCGFQG